MTTFAEERHGSINRKMSHYMQSTKCFNNRITAKISGSEVVEQRRDDYNTNQNPNSGGRTTIFNNKRKRIQYPVKTPKCLTDNNVYGVITTSSSALARKARHSFWQKRRRCNRKWMS